MKWITFTDSIMVIFPLGWTADLAHHANNPAWDVLCERLGDNLAVR